MESFVVLSCFISVLGLAPSSLRGAQALSNRLLPRWKSVRNAQVRRLNSLVRLSVVPPLLELPEPSFDEPLVDIRSSESFSILHIRGATSIPLPVLRLRSYELPAPFEAPIRLCATSLQDLNNATALLTGLGWEILPSFILDVDEALKDLGLSSYSALQASQELRWRGVAVESGSSSLRCWRPSPFLARCVHEMQLANALADSQEIERVVVDLGCGGGRDAVFLATSLGKYCKVIGVDNHGKALERAATLAEREGVQSCVEWKNLNLRKPAGLAAITDMKVDLVHGCRFLDRRIIESLRDSSLRVGGVFIWSTFMEGEVNPAPPFKPSRRLFSGELRHMFQHAKDREYEILIDEEGQLNTRSLDVPASFFCARRLA